MPHEEAIKSRYCFQVEFLGGDRPEMTQDPNGMDALAYAGMLKVCGKHAAILFQDEQKRAGQQ